MCYMSLWTVEQLLFLFQYILKWTISEIDADEDGAWTSTFPLGCLRGKPYNNGYRASIYIGSWIFLKSQ